MVAERERRSLSLRLGQKQALGEITVLVKAIPKVSAFIPGDVRCHRHVPSKVVKRSDFNILKFYSNIFEIKLFLNGEESIFNLPWVPVQEGK